MKTLGERIRELREAHDWSVRDLAKKSKVSAPFLSDVELGRRHPSDEVLARIASRLGTTVDDLNKYDARPPMQELRRMAASNPAMGFALRRVVDEGVSPEDLLSFLEQRGRGKKK
jgi:transcriptional regulator with XRE-family HTH domain